MFSMAASRHIGSCLKWNMTTAKFAADLYQIWLRLSNAAELWRFMYFQNGVRPPSWIFKVCEIWRYFCFWDVFASEPNFVWMCAAAILNSVEVKFDVRKSRGWPVSISLPNLVKMSWRAAELWLFMFLKWQPAAILDFQISEIWRYFFFEDVGFSLWAKFCVNICNRAWGMAIKKWIFKNLVNLSKWNLTSGKVAADRCLSSYQIWWRYLEGRPSYDDLCVFKMVDDPPLRYRHLNFPRWRPSSYLGFGETGNSAIRSADFENPILEPNTE